MGSQATSYAAFNAVAFPGVDGHRPQLTVPHAPSILRPSRASRLLPVRQPFVWRPHSMHSRYRRPAAVRTKSSCPDSQHLKESWNRIFHKPFPKTSDIKERRGNSDDCGLTDTLGAESVRRTAQKAA